MKKKTWMALVSVMISVSLLVGCGSQTTGNADTQAPGTQAADSSAAGAGGEQKEQEKPETADSSSDKILIGVSASITGSAPTNGLRTQQGAQMAVDEINEAGGILGRQVELYVADDGGELCSIIYSAGIIKRLALFENFFPKNFSAQNV